MYRLLLLLAVSFAMPIKIMSGGETGIVDYSCVNGIVHIKNPPYELSFNKRGLMTAAKINSSIEGTFSNDGFESPVTFTISEENNYYILSATDRDVEICILKKDVK